MTGINTGRRRTRTAVLPWLGVALALAALATVLVSTPRVAYAVPGSTEITASGTFVVPPGVLSMTVEVWGGGGGGGHGNFTVAGGGGGGGGYARAAGVVVTPGDEYAVTIGGGGAGASGGTDADDGGTTTFVGHGLSVAASGGAFGKLGADGGSAGTGGSGTPGSGIVTATGGMGGDGTSSGGGGGGGAGYIGAVEDGYDAFGGDGGSGGGADPSRGGMGGDGNGSASAGDPGAPRGGGGGGGGDDSTSGGAGGAGMVRVFWNTAVPDDTESTISANPTSVDANGVDASEITVTVRTAGDAPVEGALVTLAGSPSAGVFIAPNGAVGQYTPASGVVTFDVLRTTSGVVTFTATIETASNPDVQLPVNVTFTGLGVGPGCTTPAVPGGTFVPSLGPSGITISIWGGGSVGLLPAAISYWTTHDGDLVGYIPGAPDFVNATFIGIFTTNLPPCLGFIVRR